MKRRIKIDGVILLGIGVITVCFYQYPVLYLKNVWLDNILDVLGLLMIITGVFFRMSARGHKKTYSLQGKGLVTTGIYGYVRNPMYLGSFFIGGGFVLLLWPWWTFPIFVFCFYQRFKQQVLKEEAHLKKIFGKSYEVYCQNVPAIQPTRDKIRSVTIQDVFFWEEIWSTKEKWLLIGLPLCAIFLELVQGKNIFNLTELFSLVCFYLGGLFIYSMTCYYSFLRGKKHI